VDGTEEKAGLKFGWSLGFKSQLGLGLLRLAMTEQINEIVSQGDTCSFICHMRGEQGSNLACLVLTSVGSGICSAKPSVKAEPT